MGPGLEFALYYVPEGLGRDFAFEEGLCPSRAKDLRGPGAVGEQGLGCTLYSRYAFVRTGEGR
jgi:hypothetical protein